MSRDWRNVYGECQGSCNMNYNSSRFVEKCIKDCVDYELGSGVYDELKSQHKISGGKRKTKSVKKTNKRRKNKRTSRKSVK